MKKRLLLIMAFVAVMISCSKDDGDGNNGENPIGGEIFTLQAVKIQIPEGTELTQTMYDGTLNGMPVKLVKAPGNILVFYLPSDIETGNAELVIPALSNMTIHYNIQQTVLNGSADDVMEGFFVGLDAFAQNLDDSPRAQAVRHNIENFGDIYESASATDKIEMAAVYQANKADFDAMLTIDSGRSDAHAYFTLGRLTLASIAIAEGVACVAAGVATGTVAAATAPVIVGAVAITAGAFLAVQVFEEFEEEPVIKELLSLGGLLGVNERTETPHFTSGQSRNINFEVSERKMSTTDEANDNEKTAEFFETFNLYNSYAQTTNTAIEIINTEVNAADLNPIESMVLENTSLQSVNVNEETFGNINFTISHPNVVLEESSLLVDGQLKLKLKITGAPSAVPIETYLNYSFDNGFSSFRGKFPIIVEPSLVGTWILESFDNGIPIGEYSDNGHAVDCPSLVTNQYTMQSYTLIFGETQYSASGVEIYRDLNLSWNSNCTVTNNGTDEYETINHSESGTYSLDGNIITLYNDGNTVSAEVTYIGANKIKIDGQVYVRQ